MRSFSFTLKNQYQYSTSTSETSENVCFYFMKRSKVQGKNMSCEGALNFDNEKHFPKTISQ